MWEWLEIFKSELTFKHPKSTWVCQTKGQKLYFEGIFLVSFTFVVFSVLLLDLMYRLIDYPSDKVEARTLPSNPAEDGLKWAAIAAALAVILMGILLLLFRARKEF